MSIRFVHYDPTGTSGLTLTLRAYAAGTLALTQALTETPSSSARYEYEWTGASASTTYDFKVSDASGLIWGTGKVTTDADGSEVLPSNSLGNPGTGSLTRTVQVTHDGESGTEGLGGALVIMQPGGRWGYTDHDGNVTFNHEADTFDIVVSANNHYTSITRDLDLSTSGTSPIALEDVPASTTAEISGDVAAAVWGYANRLLTGGTIEVAVPYQTDHKTIIRGDSYLNADSRAFTTTKQVGITWPTDLASLPWTVSLKFHASPRLLNDVPAAPNVPADDDVPSEIAGTVVDASNVRFDITKAQSETFALNTVDKVSGNAHSYLYSVLATTGAKQWLLEAGTATIVDDLVTT